MNEPILQVVIPAYGESPYLKATLESAVKNLPTTVPILLIEDPSDSDNVFKTWKAFSKRIDYIKNDTRLGIADNFNKCIQMSVAKYTIILGSDDLYSNDISDQIKIFLTHKNVAAIITGAEVINKFGKSQKTYQDIAKKILAFGTKNVRIFKAHKFIYRLLIGYWFYFPAVAWNTEVLKKYKFNNRMETALDLEMFIRLIHDNYTIGNLNVNSIYYRRHQTSESSRLMLDNKRFEEEYYCYDLAYTLFKHQSNHVLNLLIRISLSIRIHLIVNFVKQIYYKRKLSYSTFKLIFRNIKFLSTRN